MKSDKNDKSDKSDESKKDELKNGESKINKSKQDELKSDESKNDEPKIDKSKNDEPKIDEPKINKSEIDEPKIDKSENDEPKINNIKQIRVILAASVVLFVILDQIVKQWARDYLRPPEGAGAFPVIDGLIGFRWATNTGAAFGIFEGGRWFFVVLTVVVIAVILVFEFKMLPYTRQNMWVRIPMTLILAGAIGNFLDRLLFGYVVDMFQFLFIDFPIFNVADILLVVGTFAYAFASLFVLRDV